MGARGLAACILLLSPCSAPAQGNVALYDRHVIAQLLWARLTNLRSLPAWRHALEQRLHKQRTETPRPLKPLTMAFSGEFG